MGDSISKMYEDEEDYEFLCRKYNEKPVGVYSNHHRWIEAKHHGNINISFEEFDKKEKTKELEREIKNLELELSYKKEKLSELK